MNAPRGNSHFRRYIQPIQTSIISKRFSSTINLAFKSKWTSRSISKKPLVLFGFRYFLKIKLTSNYCILQFLVDSPLKDSRYVMVNIYQKPEDGPFDGPVTTRQIRKMKKIEPVLPTQSGYVLDHYKHNGFLLNLPLGRYLIVSFFKRILFLIC